MLMQGPWRGYNCFSFNSIRNKYSVEKERNYRWSNVLPHPPIVGHVLDPTVGNLMFLVQKWILELSYANSIDTMSMEIS